MVIPLAVAALGVCWLLAWFALLLVFMWLVRRGADATTLRVFVRLAEAWRMPTAPMHMLELAASRRRAEEAAGQPPPARGRFSWVHRRTPPGGA
jgi:hypothetical protein